MDIMWYLGPGQKEPKHELLATMGGNGLPSLKICNNVTLQEFMQDWGVTTTNKFLLLFITQRRLINF